MAHRRPHRPPSASASSPSRRPRTALTLVSAGADRWQLKYPRAVDDRADDLAEVEHMIALGEIDCAIDELRWLLQDCSDLLVAHQWLGTLALEAEDYSLARGHFGIVFDLIRETVPSDGLRGTLPYALAVNEVIYESGRGLAHALHKTGNTSLAREVVRQLLAWDPSDPVKLHALLNQWDLPATSA